MFTVAGTLAELLLYLPLMYDKSEKWMIPVLSSSNTDLWRPDIVIINNRTQYYQATAEELQQYHGVFALFVVER